MSWNEELGAKLAAISAELDETSKAMRDSAGVSTEPKKLCCPRCHSTNLVPVGKKHSVIKGAIGATLIGVPGLLAGLNSGRVQLMCMDCGKKWNK